MGGNSIMDNICKIIKTAIDEIKHILEKIGIFSCFQNSHDLRPPRKIGTPHPGFANIKAIRLLRLP